MRWRREDRHGIDPEDFARDVRNSLDGMWLVGSVALEHGSYGCQSGCCGKAVVVYDTKGNEQWYCFLWGHDDIEETAESARALADELGVPFVFEEDERKRIERCW